MANSLPARQFGILLWKSYIIRKRHYLWTFLELVLPVLIASLSIIANSGGKAGTTIEDPIRYRPIPVGKSLRSYYTLLYTPVNEFTLNLMSRITEKVDCKGVETPEELDALVKAEIPFTISDSVEKLLLGLQENETIAGVIFHLPENDGDYGGSGIDLGNDTFLPHNLRYTLRVRDFELQSDAYPKKQDFGPFPNADHYIKKNFVAIQSLVNFAYLQMLSEKLFPEPDTLPFAIPELRDLRAQRFPYPKYIKHPRFKVSIISRFFAGTGKLNTLQLTMEYCTVLGFVVMIVLLIKGKWIHFVQQNKKDNFDFLLSRRHRRREGEPSPSDAPSDGSFRLHLLWLQLYQHLHRHGHPGRPTDAHVLRRTGGTTQGRISFPRLHPAGTLLGSVYYLCHGDCRLLQEANQCHDYRFHRLAVCPGGTGNAL